MKRSVDNVAKPPAATRKSGRKKDEPERGVILDEAARARALKRRLDALEFDNHHADNTVDMKIMRTDEVVDGEKKKKKKGRDWSRNRPLAIILAEASAQTPSGCPTYDSIAAGPSSFPARHFCSVCGFTSRYTCMRCGMRYCSIDCHKTHIDTRCLKKVL